jgi:hypothetical protein
MKIEKVFAFKEMSLDIEKVKVNQSLSLFRAKLITVTNDKRKVHHSEGIAETSYLVRSQINCSLPINNDNYIKSNPVFLELIRKYGHPDALLERDCYSDIFPRKLMVEEIEKMKFKFNDFEDKELLNKILHIDISNHEVTRVIDGSQCNVAKFSENISFSEYKYNNFVEMIDELFDQNRLNFTKSNTDRRGKYMLKGYYDNHKKYVAAKVIFTDEEYLKIVSGMPTNKRFSDEAFEKSMDNLDIFGINKYIKTKEEREID